MPADYESTAQGLAVSPSRSSESPPPGWSRLQSSSTSHRRMRSFDLPAANKPWYSEIWKALKIFNTQIKRIYCQMTVLQRFLAAIAIVAVYALLVVGWIYSHSLFDWLHGVSTSWRALPGGWLIVFALIFISSFPPMIGYSTINTMSGFVYGFPHGWPIVAVGCTLGSLCAFIASRTIFSGYIDRTVGKDPKFIALSQVLKRDGLLYLTGIRFCPLPFSLSNGFLATIPSISPIAFAISTALSTPKLLIHVFIGSRLAALAESGDKMSFGDKMVNYLGMGAGAIVGIVVGWVVYRRTMARAAEVAREEAAELGRAGPAFLDVDGETMIDPEDAAALMSDDDMSLWDTQLDEPDIYHDEQDESKGKTGESGSKPANNQNSGE
ncbi:unnamed protein product [Clonostachys rosea]|uniref:Golgi apparatus membrane protein TVP38 n=1 Tax=Bionectria ochroleuca TaxID=29856 RepID=A0ABY6UBC3_BIOOC|nr:unnamed protein product [Clonostachys rosea]